MNIESSFCDKFETHRMFILRSIMRSCAASDVTRVNNMSEFIARQQQTNNDVMTIS